MFSLKTGQKNTKSPASFGVRKSETGQACPSKMRGSVCHAADWTRCRVDNSDDFAAKQNPLCGFLVCRHPLCRYLPCASILALRSVMFRAGPADGSALHTSPCHALAAARRAASLRLGRKTVPLSRPFGFLPSLRSIRAAPHASAFRCMHRRGGGIIPTPLNMRF